jgi:hypothetical protein
VFGDILNLSRVVPFYVFCLELPFESRGSRRGSNARMQLATEVGSDGHGRVGRVIISWADAPPVPPASHWIGGREFREYIVCWSGSSCH